MLRFLQLISLIGLFVSPSIALASYHVFCEMEGEVSSMPIFSDFIEFEFIVMDSRDIKFEDGSGGEPDCRLMKGKKIKVLLEPDDAGDQTQISKGARLTIHRYEITVVLDDTGDVVQSVEHVRVSE